MRRNRGLSLLLETVVGIGIFSVSLLLVFALFPSFHRSMTQAKNVSVATHLAREILEQERSKSYATIGPMPPTPIRRACVINGVPVDTPFQVDMTCTTIPGPPEYKVLVVTVRWTEAAIDRSVALETYVYDI
ncbi:MAG: type II secretion system protein [Candidatus Eremiobacterota bacterium]